MSVERRREVVSKETSPLPQRAPQPELAEATGEVPQALLLLFRDDAARRALVQPAAVTVVSASEKQWPDGSMGCPQPGMMYTQMVIPGYRVVLSAAGQNYAYHSDLRGKFILCEKGKALPPASEQKKQPAAQ